MTLSTTKIQAGWTDERVERAKELWIQGESAAFIARDLGDVSRNGVIGKMHRLGLPRRNVTSQATPKPKFARERYTKPRRKPKPIFIIEKLAEPESLRLTIDDLRFNTCRFIADTPDENATYCGHRTRPLSSFCPYHHSICYTKPERHSHNA